MCGINIIVDKTKGQFGPEAIRKMNAALRHRGPDGQPHFEKIDLDWATIWLGATRLALRGGQAGRQPMRSPSGQITLVYNGEIYNIGPPGQSDTAALANLLEQQLKVDQEFELNGMYAFAWIDHQARSIRISRDPRGIKPLFMAKAAFGYALSSEAEALLEIGLLPGLNPETQPIDQPDRAMPLPEPVKIQAWLTNRHPGPNATLFGDDGLVSESMPIDEGKGHLAVRGFDRQGSYCKFDLKDLKPDMIRVLERQLVSDRPIGLMLSGGYDSAFLLACLAAMGKKLPCYTLAATPDAAPAAAMVKKLGFKHRLVSMPTHWQDLETYMQSRLHPIADSGGFATWLVARAAQEDGVPVLLSGAGADELLGGYRRHRAFYLLQKPGLRFASLKTQRAAFMRLAQWNSLGYLMKSSNRLETNSGVQNSFNGPFLDPRPWELADYLRGDLLMVTDQATMAHGVEARVPFLDNEIIAQLMGVSWRVLMAARHKAPLIPALKEAGVFDLLLNRKTGFGLWDTGIFEGLPVLQRLQKESHILYTYLHCKKVQKEIQSGTPHARFSIAQLAHTLEFIQSGQTHKR